MSAAEAFSRVLLNHSDRVDIPHPSRPGVRVVGFAYLEAQAGMATALCALDAIAVPAKNRSKRTLPQ